jgi:hypothetical protein
MKTGIVVPGRSQTEPEPRDSGLDVRIAPE